MAANSGDRKAREAEFHDHLRDSFPFQRYSPGAEAELANAPEWSNFKFYSIERRSRASVDSWLKQHCPGARVLDFGCGNGEDTLNAARWGAARAIGIDVSPGSIENGRAAAAAAGLTDRVEFHVMDGEHMAFDDDSFDVVIVYGVLHHMDLRHALSEIARVLRPRGAAICTEALGHNLAIKAYRRRTPHLRTEWEAEHILTRRDVRLARDYFHNVQSATYHLATIAAVPFRKTRIFSPVLRTLEQVDRVLLNIPMARWQAWQVVFTLGHPREQPIRR